MDKLYRGLTQSGCDEIRYKDLAEELGVAIPKSFCPDPGMREIEARFREVLRIWLSREDPKPSWNKLKSALMKMGCVPLAASIIL